MAAKNININLDHFKINYNKAIEEGKGFEETFTYEDEEFVVGYAKYLIEYLESIKIDKR